MDIIVIPEYMLHDLSMSISAELMLDLSAPEVKERQ
jgi:hypothetical protein